MTEHPDPAPGREHGEAGRPAPERHTTSRGAVSHTEAPWTAWDTPREQWLMTEQSAGSWPRSMLLEVLARVLFPTVLVFSVYLLLAGHNNAGGGFSGGLVAGLAFVLRYVAGGGAELATAVRVRPPVVIGTGLAIAVTTALAPVLLGEVVLSSAVWKLHLPVLGELKLTTNLALDLGVYLLIIGVVVDLLRTLGSGTEFGGPGVDGEGVPDDPDDPEELADDEDAAGGVGGDGFDGFGPHHGPATGRGTDRDPGSGADGDDEMRRS
ncbi:Multisubunit Na+/H+ antiporter, MnhB subunit [Prauserella aidingensis]|uniref:MnhB domain-containing protein n=1 Tax=Prauserella aidingensis TaxID=387890 RepID=UPI0027E308AD|nr:MnhB domain-containing protein [Prauserella aidingensis]MCP2253872.1 Multisubunit Na+/H+ antiporter, MnhB subunit [Prauserella aidingensis]